MPDLHDPAEYAATYDRTEILRFVAALAPGFTRDEPAFRVVAVLVASLVECGPDPEAIAELLGYEESWVRTVGARLRLCGVWRDEEVAVEGLADAARFSDRSWWRAVRAGLGRAERRDGDPRTGPRSVRGPLQAKRHASIELNHGGSPS